MFFVVIPHGISLFPYLKRLNLDLIISNYGKSGAQEGLLLIAVRIAIVVHVAVTRIIVRVHIAIIIRISVKTGRRTIDVIRIHGAIHAVMSGYPYINSILLFLQT